MSIRFRKLCEDSEIPRCEIRAQAREFSRYQPGESQTKQSFKDECDINKILEKASRTGMVSHLSKYEGQYADFADVDLQTMMNTVARANTLFAELPAEIRREFGNSQEAFFSFVNNPENRDSLKEKLPALAKSGNQLPNVDRTTRPIETSPTGSSSTAPEAPKLPKGAKQARTESEPPPAAPEGG